MAIGNPGALGGARDLARSPEFVKEVEQHLDRLSLAVAMKAPDGFDLDADQLGHLIGK